MPPGGAPSDAFVEMGSPPMDFPPGYMPPGGAPSDAFVEMGSPPMDFPPGYMPPGGAPSDAFAEIGGMDAPMMDDGGMEALGGALDPAPVGDMAPMDPAGDALSGAMDQVADQGAGGMEALGGALGDGPAPGEDFAEMGHVADADALIEAPSDPFAEMGGMDAPMMDDGGMEALGGMDAPMMDDGGMEALGGALGDGPAPGEDFAGMMPDDGGMGALDDGGMGALGDALGPPPGDMAPMDPVTDALGSGMEALGAALDGPAPMDPAADALTGAMDAAQIQGGDSAPADAAAMDEAAAGTAEYDLTEVDEPSDASVTPDDPIV
jgi:hypothetical protein